MEKNLKQSASSCHLLLICGSEGLDVFCYLQVIGNSGLPYICFAESNYCECLAYRYSGERNSASIVYF